MNSDEAVQAYSLKLTVPDGRTITLPQNLLTPVQAKSIADDLKTLARESGLGLVEIELRPIGSDDRARILEEARSFFSGGEPKSFPTFRTAVKCSLCQTVIPLDEALSSSPLADDFLSADPIAGDSRCEMCSRHSVENCQECRGELLLSITRSSGFVCEACSQRAREDVA
jgi:hypothetical protein